MPEDLYNMDYDYPYDDIGYSDPNRFICTDPSCDGVGCPGENHISPDHIQQQS